MLQLLRENRPMFIIGMLFFVFGFITWLNATLIPFLKIACDLTSSLQAFLVTFAFYMAYFFLALPASYILRKTGFRNGMSWGLVIMGMGALLFLPAAYERSFPLFLSGLFVQGTGLALLQTASNPYISIIGPIDQAAKRISIMGICNKVAGALSPLVLGTFLLSDTATLQEQIASSADTATRNALLDEMAARVIWPYLVMAVVLFLLAFVVRRSGLPEIETAAPAQQENNLTERTSIFQFPYLLLGALCLFLYVGAEVMAGDAIGIYGQAEGMAVDQTRYFTSFTLVAMLVGYLAGVFLIPRYISQQQALLLSAVLGLTFTAATYFTSGYAAIFFIASLGLANALMWPAIFPLAIDGLGRFTNTGSALLVMGISGGALIPLLFGYLSEHPQFGNAPAFFLCLFPAYLYIVYYAAYGHKRGKVVRSAF